MATIFRELSDHPSNNEVCPFYINVAFLKVNKKENVFIFVCLSFISTIETATKNSCYSVQNIKCLVCSPKIVKTVLFNISAMVYLIWVLSSTTFGMILKGLPSISLQLVKSI